MNVRAMPWLCAICRGWIAPWWGRKFPHPGCKTPNTDWRI